MSVSGTRTMPFGMGYTVAIANVFVPILRRNLPLCDVQVCNDILFAAESIVLNMSLMVATYPHFRCDQRRRTHRFIQYPDINEEAGIVTYRTEHMKNSQTMLYNSVLAG